MGGYGSGRHFGAPSKATTESRLQLDVRSLKKQNSLKPGTAGVLSWLSNNRETSSLGFKVHQDRIILHYRRHYQDKVWEDVEEIVNLNFTPCNYGGKRVWFLCPQCGRQVLALYLNGKDFLCRHCCRLTYAVQQKTMKDRLFKKARKFRERLAGSRSLFDPIPPKPKGMRWRTYWRFYREAEQTTMKCFAFMDRELEKARRTLLTVEDKLQWRVAKGAEEEASSLKTEHPKGSRG
jgi:hypothetical protein